MSDRAMFDNVERLRLEYDLRQTDVARLCNLSRNIMGTWKTRGTLSRSVPILSDTFFWSQDYIYGNSQVMWRNDLITAREELRSWLRDQDLWEMTIAERFVVVWDKWRSLLPMREEIWAIYTYMAVKGNEDAPISISKWNECKQNKYQPGRMQIDGAKVLTDIPVKWWYTGDPLLLRDFTHEEIVRLRELTIERGIDLAYLQAAISAYQAKAN